jgi:HK97 family phage major capsid protein
MFFKVGKVANRKAVNVDEPVPVMLTTPAIDSYGDSVNPLGADVVTRAFDECFPLLMNHDSRVKSIVGKVGNLKITKDGIEAMIYMAPAGTSEDVDVARALMAGGYTPFVSIGFLADMEACEPLDPEEPWGGYRINKWQLVEVSITPTPANPEARLKDLNPAFGRMLSALAHTSSAVMCTRSIHDQMMSTKLQASDTQSKPTPKGRTNMSLADKVQAKQQEIVKTKDQIAAITNSLDDTGAMTDEQSEALHDLATKLDSLNGHLKNLEHLERTLAATSGGTADPAPVPRVEARSRTPGMNKAGMALACVIKGLMTNKDPLSLAREECKDIPEMEMLVRAATAPAVTGNPTWAGNLVQETWGPLVEAMYAMTVYNRIPGMRLTFEGKFNLPVQGGVGNLAGDFIAENGVIPVKSGSIGTVSLQPHTLGVISAFSKELMRRSVPSIQGIIQNQILKDTARTIDVKFLDAIARTAGTRPAGLQDTTETGAGNIVAQANVATGAGNSTVKEINASTRAMLGRVWAIDAGVEGVWVMNPLQRLALEDKQDGTTGQFVFRDEVQRGRFRGFPILESTNVTSGVTAFIAGDSMAFATELLPYFEQSDQATLHFEDTSPATISTAGTPPALAHPVISLFQQNLVAVKGIWTLDWRILRQAGVQVLTATTGW